MIEIMMVVIIIGIMAAFAVPKFTTTVARGKSRDAVTKLQMIHSANMLYKSRNHTNVPSCSSVGDINSALGLNINANGLTYACNGTTACTATGTGGLVITALLDNVIYGTSNPTCVPTALCP